MKRLSAAILVFAMFGLARGSIAATAVTSGFAGGKLDPALEDAAHAFRINADGSVQNPSGAHAYIRTIDTDYGKVDFTFEIDVDRSADSSQIVYIGVGDGVVDDAFYGEPDHALGFHIDPPDASGFGPNFVVGQIHDTLASYKASGHHSDTGIGNLTAAPLHVRIDKTGDTMTYSLTQGSVVRSTTKSYSRDADYLDATTTRLYAGTLAPGTRLSNFSLKVRGAGTTGDAGSSSDGGATTDAGSSSDAGATTDSGAGSGLPAPRSGGC